MSRRSGPPPEAARYVARRGRLVRARPAVLVGALAARAGLLSAYVAWPTAASPLLLLPAGDVRAAAWVRRTFEPWAERRLSAATWNALRAGTLVLPSSPGLAAAAAERGLGRPLNRPVIGCVSASGHPHSKLLCFLFEADEPEPSVVVKGIPARGEGARLASELEHVQEIRDRLTDFPEVLRGLPPAPLWSGPVGDEQLSLEPVDPLAAATGVEDREAALGWLASFQRATAHGTADPWGGDAEVAELRDWISFAWGRLRPAYEDAVLSRWETLAAPLRGQPLPRCSVHGDFWRGNIASDGRELRIYDWEWARPEGRPYFDLWTYELGPLRQELRPEEAPSALEAARRRVEESLRSREADPRFAAALLAPVAAELTARVQRVRGLAPQHEERAELLLAAIERLLEA